MEKHRGARWEMFPRRRRIDEVEEEKWPTSSTSIVAMLIWSTSRAASSASADERHVGQPELVRIIPASKVGTLLWELEEGCV